MTTESSEWRCSPPQCVGGCSAPPPTRCLYVIITIPALFAQTVTKHPDKAALIYEATREVWTFRELQQRCHAVAHWARAQGWLEGDVVALYMKSQPQVVALWLGLATVGVEAAVINHNLRQQSLLHCVGVSRARAVVFGTEMREGRNRKRLLIYVEEILNQEVV
ncbi:long-chain fatty acid transport protein 4-like [Labrus mixtus]|uniref:long-chain fatty acid transport protein 4-like n=1 Tax=Labrus mixtus TaxID=508554 RepID=UPI0029C0F73F|nr:long-chain fatty acid transport protein 4-like [Labrus mixtus]